MTSLLYGLAVLTPLVLAGVSLALIWVRWIDRRAEDRVRAEHGLPPRAARPARAIEDVEGRPAPVQALRRRDAAARERRPEDAGAARRTAAARPPWPLDDLADRPDPQPTARRTPDVEPVPRPAPAPGVVPAPSLPTSRTEPGPAPEPAPSSTPTAPVDARESARAALARAAATLQELERTADRAERYGTKECPECDRSVRLTARVCPHCRHRMAPEPERRDVTAA